MKLTPLYNLPREYQLLSNGAMQLRTMKVNSEEEEFLYMYCFMFYV